MKWAIRAYAFGLLIYTGWRTFDFMMSQLPQSDLSFYLALAFLLCTEIGLVLWHEAHLTHVTTDNQNRLTAIMTWLDFAGSLMAGIADMIIHQTMLDGYVVPREFALMLMYGLPLIFGLNVAAAILYEQWDAETLEEKAEKALRFEAHRQAIKDLKKERSGFAELEKKNIYKRIKGQATRSLEQRYGERVIHFNAETPAAGQATGVQQDARSEQPNNIITNNGASANPTNQRSE